MHRTRASGNAQLGKVSIGGYLGQSAELLEIYGEECALQMGSFGIGYSG